MCLFEDGFRAAAAASLEAPSLTVSTRMRGILLRSRHAGEVARLSADLYCTPRMPFVVCNELAIATKSIASVCPHAERTPWVPF